MKSYTLLACFLLCLSGLNAQDLLFQESFETDNEGITYNSNTFENGCDFFARHNSPPNNGCHFETITGLVGSFMWASENTDNAPSDPSIEFGPINITDYLSLSTSLKLAQSYNDVGWFDFADELRIEYSIDGSSFETCGLFTPNDFEFGDLALDLDLEDGTFGPHGIELEEFMQDFSFDIPETGSSLILRISIDSGVNGELGIDDVRIFGVLQNSGCTDINACNYDFTAEFDDGSCEYEGYFIPLNPETGPAILGCVDIPDYVFGDQECIQSVIDSNPDCALTNWSSECYDAYLDCLGCDTPVIYIPSEENEGFLPAIFGCGYPPPGYIIPVQSCALQVIESDSFCLTDFWDFICQDAYNSFCWGCSQAGCTDPSACNFDTFATCDDGSCIVQDQYYIPIVPGAGPLIIACEAPEGYILAERDCAMAIAELDPTCLEFVWDFICQGQYIDCLQGDYLAYGCTYSDAQNFDSSAAIDDGSCLFTGSGTCEADLNNDGLINTSDLTSFLAVYGSPCE